MSQFKILKPDLQITFFHRLKEIRKTYLLDALLSVVATLQIPKIDAELGNFVSHRAYKRWQVGASAERSFSQFPGYFMLILTFWDITGSF